MFDKRKIIPMQKFDEFLKTRIMLPAGDLQAASSIYYTSSCKHSLVLLRMGEIIARNMLSWLKLLTKLLLLHLFGF